MHKTILTTVLFLAAWSSVALPQDRAPSCWLHYKDGFSGDILVNTVRVQAPSPTYTYYCNLQWNAGMEAGGYCGMQEHPDGRNFIFSIWDPISNNEAITAAFQHEGTKVENFGGEGTGLKSWNFEIGWETGRYYSFVTRAWDHADHTMFGFWVFDHSDSVWHHLVTMDFPVAGARFNSTTGSFIEDWLGNGWETRTIQQKHGWKRKAGDGSWFALEEATFSRVDNDAGAANYAQSYDGGIEGDHYFMKSGGPVSPVTNRSGATLRLNTELTEPAFKKTGIHAFPDDPAQDTLYIQWVPDPAALPQFSYTMELFGNSQFAGTPMIAVSEVDPQQRSLALPLGELPLDANYYYRFRITDIFDHPSGYIEGAFRRESPAAAGDVAQHHGFLVYPNPSAGKFMVLAAPANVQYRILTTDGRTLGQGILDHPGEIDLSSHEPGLYLLELNHHLFKSTERLVLE